MPNPSTIAMEDEWAEKAEPDYWYLAGPMTGVPQFNFPAFDDASRRLRVAGYNIVSPAELDDPQERRRALASPDGAAEIGFDLRWRSFLRRDANIVMDDRCIGVICLPGWEGSRGACLETYIAEAFDKPLLKFDARGQRDFHLTVIENREFAITCFDAGREAV